MISIGNTVPVSSLFILLLIIGGNYLGILFPCQLQYTLENNIMIKHFLAFLTLVFFVVLADVDNKKTLKEVVISSFYLYIWFILIIRMNAKFFIALVSVISLIYVLKLYKKELVKDNKIKSAETLNKIMNFLFILSIIITIVGFLIYYFEKRIEYGKKFKNSTFLFGKVNCRNYSPKLDMADLLKEMKKQITKIEKKI